MKKLLLAFCLMLFCNIYSFAQTPLEFSKVIDFETRSKDDLFTQTKAWLSEFFFGIADDANAIFDREGGLCIVHVSNPYIHTDKKINKRAFGSISSKIKIEIKDGKVRYSQSDFFHQNDNLYYPSAGFIYEGDWTQDDQEWRKELWADLQSEVTLKFNLTSRLYEKTINDSNDDW